MTMYRVITSVMVLLFNSTTKILHLQCAIIMASRTGYVELKVD